MPEQSRLINGLIFRLVRKHIAGPTYSSALKIVRALDQEGMGTTITFLNENVKDQAKAKYNTNTYIHAMKQASRLGLHSSISVRPSQIGFTINNGWFEKNLSELASAAKDYGITVWLENEEGITPKEVLEACASQQSGPIGLEIPMQLNEKEMQFVLGRCSKLKLITSGYKSERKPHVRHHDEKVDKVHVYCRDIDILAKRCSNIYIHDSDEKVLAKVASASKQYRKSIVFELPLGYSKRWKTKLAAMKLNLNAYVPYGKDWASYALYRLTDGHIREIAASVLKYKNERQSDGEENGQ